MNSIILHQKEGFKERFNNLKDEKGLTLDIIADDIGSLKSTLSMITNGKQKLNLEILNKLAEYFKVTPAYLTGESNTRTLDEQLPMDYIVVVKKAMSSGITASAMNQFIDILKKNKPNGTQKKSHTRVDSKHKGEKSL